MFGGAKSIEKPLDSSSLKYQKCFLESAYQRNLGGELKVKFTSSNVDMKQPRGSEASLSPRIGDYANYTNSIQDINIEKQDLRKTNLTLG